VSKIEVQVLKAMFKKGKTYDIKQRDTTKSADYLLEIGNQQGHRVTYAIGMGDQRISVTMAAVCMEVKEVGM